MKLTQSMIYFNVACQGHIVERMASTRRGHLIDKAHNAWVKLSVKPFIVQTKNVSNALRQKLV